MCKLEKTLLGGAFMKKKQETPVQEEISERQSSTDPMGSWTGIPANPYEEPVQDADDL